MLAETMVAMKRPVWIFIPELSTTRRCHAIRSSGDAGNLAGSYGQNCERPVTACDFEDDRETSVPVAEGVLPAFSCNRNHCRPRVPCRFHGGNSSGCARP